MRIPFVLFAAIMATTAQTQSWPTRPVTMISPSAAGGAPDVIARALSERLSA